MDCIEPKTPLRPRGGKKKQKSSCQQVQEFESLFLSDGSDPNSVAEVTTVEQHIYDWLAHKGVTHGDPQAKKDAFFCDRKSKVSDRLSVNKDLKDRDSLLLDCRVASTRSSDQLPPLYLPPTNFLTPKLASRRQLAAPDPIALFSPQNCRSPKSPVASRHTISPGPLLTGHCKDGTGKRQENIGCMSIQILPPCQSAPLPEENNEYSLTAPNIGNVEPRSRSRSPSTPEIPQTRPRRPHCMKDAQLFVANVLELASGVHF